VRDIAICSNCQTGKKRDANCAVRTDADVAETVRLYAEVAYDDMVVSDW
jgi:hypothetical protein